MSRTFVILLALIGLAMPSVVSAHAFGQSFTLPIPLWVYLYGGGAAVALSFVIIGYFLRGTDTEAERPRDLSRFAIVRVLTGRHARAALRVMSVVLFSAAVVGGFVGQEGSLNQNFTIVSFWIILMLGFTYLSAIFGNLWTVVNPFGIIVGRLMALMGEDYTPALRYPQWLGYLPALLFYFGFIWLELLSGGIGTQPIVLAVILLNYLVAMYIGSMLFGKDIWFKHADFFTVFFGLVSKIAPFQMQEDRLYVRSPWKRLAEERGTHLGLLFFILFMLSSTAFDGFQETRTWWNIYFSISPVSAGSRISPPTLGTIVLLLSPLLFFAVYFLAVRLMKTVTRAALSTRVLLRDFAFSLIPIAVAYNVAHYFNLLLVSGQGIIPALSDPLSLGWDVFGTADYVVNVGIISAETTWHLQVAFILLGHILAVYVAHLVALRVFANHKQAIISQLPMLLLMVFYTLMGLWILSQPIAVGG